MPRNFERTFTLRTVIQDGLTNGLNRLRERSREVVRPLQEMTTGLRQSDLQLAEVARAATAADEALEGFEGVPRNFRRSVADLRSGAEAAEQLEQALRRAADAPGIAAADARDLRNAAREAEQARVAATGAGTDEAAAERASARRRLTQARVDARRLARETEAARSEARRAAEAASSARSQSTGERALAAQAQRDLDSAVRTAEGARKARVSNERAANTAISRLRRNLERDLRVASEAESSAEAADDARRVREAAADQAQARAADRQAAVESARQRERATAAAVDRATAKGRDRAIQTAETAARARVRAETSAEAAIQAVRVAGARAAGAIATADRERRNAEELREVADRRQAEVRSAERIAAERIRIDDRVIDQREVEARQLADRLRAIEVEAAMSAAAETEAIRERDVTRRIAQERAAALRTSRQAVRAIGNEPVAGIDALRDAERAFEGIESSAARIKGLINDVGSQGRVITGTARAYRSFVTAAGVAASATARLARGMQSLARQTNSAVRSIAAAARGLASLRTLAVVAVLAIGTRGVVAYADSWLELSNRLKLINDDSAGVARATEAVFQISQEARTEVEATADTYFRYGRSVDALRDDQERLAAVTLLTSKAVAISATSAESARAALFQFGQGLSADALRGQELNSVLEQTPRLAKALADGLGIAQGELKRFATEGNLTAQAVVEALESQASKINAEFALTGSTIGQAITRFQNALGRAVDLFFNQSGASSGLVRLIGQVTDAITDFTDVFQARVFGISETVSRAFDQSISDQERRQAQEQLLTVAQSLGSLLNAIMQGAGEVLVGVIGSGVRAIIGISVATLRSQLADVSLDVFGPIFRELPGGEEIARNLGIVGSTRTQLESAEAALESERARLKAAEETSAELLSQLAIVRSLQQNPPNPSFGSQGESAADLAQRAREIREQLATSEATVQDASTRRTIAAVDVDTLTSRLKQDSADIAREVDESFLESSQFLALMASNSAATIRGAYDDLVRTVGENIQPVEQQVVNFSGSTDSALDRLFEGLETSASSAVDSLSTAFERSKATLAELGRAQQEFIARDLQAAGDERAAARLRLLIAQRQELESLQADGAESPVTSRLNADRLRATQGRELQRFDVDTQRAEVLERVTAASERLIEVEERAANQLAVGNITRTQATELVRQQREAFTNTAEIGEAELDRLKEQFPELIELIRQTQDELNALKSPPSEEVPTEGREGLLAGVLQGIRDVESQAKNTFSIGLSIIGSIQSSLTDGLVGAIEAGVAGTKSWGEAFRDWAVQALLSLGKVLAQAVILAAVAAGLNAIAPGLAAVLGQSAQLGSQVGGRNEGGVVGRNSGGSVMPARGETLGNGNLRRRGLGMGHVDGPRGPNRDTVITALTTGEVVWSRPAVARAGGPSQVMEWHDSLLRGFNRGGVVGRGSVAEPRVRMEQQRASSIAASGPEAAQLDTSDMDQMAPLARAIVPLIIDDLSENPDRASRLRAITG